MINVVQMLFLMHMVSVIALTVLSKVLIGNNAFVVSLSLVQNQRGIVQNSYMDHIIW